MARFDLTLPELEAYRPDILEPADFDAFWTRTIAEARGRGGPARLEPVSTPLRAVEVFDVTFPGFAGDPVKAWLLLPRDRSGLLPAVAEFVGYGGGRGLPHEHLAWASSGYAHLVMDTRGQGSAWGGGGATADPHGSGPSVPGFLTRGIEDPDGFYYRRVFTDAVRAVDALRGMAGVDPDRIAVTGGSQGGGIALAAAGLSDGLVAAMPDVPFLCHFERAVGLTDADPYREVTRYLSVHRDARDSVFRTLSYFDGATFAARAGAAALFSVALLDPICPPSTVFAAFNHWAADDKEIAVYSHNEHEGGGPRQWERQAAFLSARLGPA